MVGEMLLRELKDLLKRTLGKAVLKYEELLTFSCDCEYIINGRPLIYVSEDSDDQLLITTVMFLMNNSSLNVTDLNLSDFAKFQKRLIFQAKRLKDRGRFRKEYLGLPVQRPEKRTARTLKAAEVFLVESTNKKRLYLPFRQNS
ncbi:hypothetical protein AVEN_68834-1 [Araneus ventricosus]|uniref:Uncharacterized protein n=1 Tax=Araneus ventricosus TaxID=182803 RepID=A0A4Y2C524_ARAVE|nr:hypothetical protein AVEN_68834-1 [Araneus ventricosus]